MCGGTGAVADVMVCTHVFCVCHFSKAVKSRGIIPNAGSDMHACFLMGTAPSSIVTMVAPTEICRTVRRDRTAIGSTTAQVFIRQTDLGKHDLAK